MKHRTKLIVVLLATLSSTSPFSATAAQPAEIVVTAGVRLRSSDRIAPLLGAASYETDLLVDRPGSAGAVAWREAGLVYFRGVNLFGGNGVLVSRRARRGFRYDSYSALYLRYRTFDRRVKHVMQTLKAVPIFNVGLMPDALSSCSGASFGSDVCPPTDWDEWSRLLTSVTRHIDAKFPNLSQRTWYEVWNEPDSGSGGVMSDYWKGYEWERSTGAGSLRSSVDLFIAAYHGIKAANPRARVAGPVTSHWAVGPNDCGGADWGVSEWLAQLAADGAGVVPDAIVYHDYAWAAYEDGRLRCFDYGDDPSRASWLQAEAWTRKTLAQNGFAPDTPILVTEHNRDLGADHVQYLAAAHLAVNIARVADPRNGSNVVQADIYVFDGYPGHPMAMFTASPECRRPTWAAFSMLGSMLGGDILQTQSAGTPIDVIATAGTKAPLVRVLLVNDSPDAASVSLVIRDLTGWSNVSVRMQAIDEGSDACTPDPGTWQAGAVESDGTFTSAVEMPRFSVRQITISPN